jgi:hypothetical protein
MWIVFWGVFGLTSEEDLWSSITHLKIKLEDIEVELDVANKRVKDTNTFVEKTRIHVDICPLYNIVGGDTRCQPKCG